MDATTLNPDSVLALAATQDEKGGAVWFAARTSGLFRSTDRGETWTDAYAALQLDEWLTTASLTLSPDYVSDRTLFAGALGGILRSVDGGEQWTVAELPPPPPYVVSLAASPNFAQDGLVFAATLEDGVFRSWDRGASWASWNFGLLDLNVYCLIPSPAFGEDDTLFVGTESGVFYSTNGGRAWRETGFPMDDGPVLSLAVAATDGTSCLLLAGTESHGVYRSRDCGLTWSSVALQDSGEAVNYLAPLPGATGESAILACTDTTVVVLSGDGAHVEPIWSAPSGAQINAAAPYDDDGQPAALIGTNDGDVLCIPFHNKTYGSDGDRHD